MAGRDTLHPSDSDSHSLLTLILKTWLSRSAFPLSLTPYELRFIFLLCKKEFRGGITVPHLTAVGFFRFNKGASASPTRPRSSLWLVCLLFLHLFSWLSLSFQFFPFLFFSSFIPVFLLSPLLLSFSPFLLFSSFFIFLFDQVSRAPCAFMSMCLHHGHRGCHVCESFHRSGRGLH